MKIKAIKSNNTAKKHLKRKGCNYYPKKIKLQAFLLKYLLSPSRQISPFHSGSTDYQFSIVIDFFARKNFEFIRIYTVFYAFIGLNF